MKRYIEHTANIVKDFPIQVDEIFNYESDPYKKKYDAIFNFYSDALIIHSSYGIKPHYFYFNDNKTVNAAAGCSEGKYIIRINSGTIDHLIGLFLENPDIIVDSGNDGFIEFERSLDSPISELMYQNALHFTFYHEMAHLVQKSKLLTSTLYERPEFNGKFNLRKHILELDADTFSSLCLGDHLIQYIEKIEIDIKDDNIEMILTIICSSILFYFLSFETSKLDIYFKEHTHPHPIIRITNVVLHVTRYVLQAFNQKGYKFNINHKDIIRNSIIFSNNIAVNKHNSNQIIDYLDILQRESDNIISYQSELFKLASQDSSLATNKRNASARNSQDKKKIPVKKKSRKKRLRTNKQIVEYWNRKKRRKRTRIKCKKRKY